MASAACSMLLGLLLWNRSPSPLHAHLRNCIWQEEHRHCRHHELVHQQNHLKVVVPRLVPLREGTLTMSVTNPT